MSRTIIFALFVVVAVAACSALPEGHRQPTEQDRCKTIPRKRWVVTIDCERKLCGDKGILDQVCPLLYNPGCVCQKGYFETANGDCVLERECPQ